MKAVRSPVPCSMSESFFSQSPVSSGEVILCSSSIVITCRPFGVGWRSLPTRSMYSRRMSVSIDLRARRRRAEAGLLHRLAQLLVVDELAGGLHRREQRRLGVARRRLRHLVLALGGERSAPSAPPRASAARRLLESSSSDCFSASGSSPYTPRQPASSVILPRVRKLSLLDVGDDGRARVARGRMEHGEEALRDEVEDAALVGREPLDVVGDVGRDDRVVVGDLRVVDHALERELVEAMTNVRALAVVGDRLERVDATIFSCGTMSPER